jgi:hypothetical protein
MLLLILGCGAAAGGSIVLSSDGVSDYQIVVAAGADAQARAAADELALHLEKITGARLPIVADAGPLLNRAIHVGRNRHLPDLIGNIDMKALGEEGFCIRTVGDHLVIVGAGKRGVLNGVWDFLERELGCRWYTPTLSFTPAHRTLTIEPIDRTHVPPFEVRTIWGHNAEHEGPRWPARMRLNCFVRHIRDWEGHVRHPLLDGSPYWAEHGSHTFPRLVPSSAYYEKHPDYFALVDGTRIKQDGQLCMTHPDVAAISARWANDVLDHDPRASIASISASDLGNFCRCDRCTATRRRYPELADQDACGNAAMLVHMVNDVARRVRSKHPDALVSTLAYQHTRIPARDMKVEDNVVIRYCPIEVCVLHPIEDGGCAWNQRNYEGTRFADELATWTKISPRVWIWYYAFDRGGCLSVSPWLGTMQSNLRLFHRLGVKGVQVQARIWPLGPWAPFHDLKAYLFARLLWDPTCDVEADTREFCAAFYGPAADRIIDYLNALHDPDTYTESVATHHKHLPGTHLGVGQFTAPVHPHLFDRFTQWFDEAEQLVENEPLMRRRVTAARLTLQYLILSQLDQSHSLHGRARLRFFDTARRVGLVKVLDPKTDKVIDVDKWETIVRQR